jgi:predicted TIM-barrel fold metal-dependent hydrolase
MTLRRRTFLGSAFGAVASFALPRGVLGAEKPPFPLYDTHAHFFSNDIVHYPFSSGAPQAVRERIIARAMASPMTPEVVFKSWDEAGVAMGCGVQYNSTYSTDNRYLLDITRAHPDRITAIVILNPVDGATPALLGKMAREDRIAGVRFTGNPDAGGEYHFLSPAAAPSWEAANRLGLVVVLMPVSPETAPAMARVAEHAARYPRVRIVLDHIGFPRPEATPSFGLSPEHVALARYKNVYYKYTTLLIEQLRAAKVPTGPFLAHMVRTYGADRMVWGTDIGNTPGTMQDFVQMALASAYGLPLRDRRALFHDTAKRIFLPGGAPAA